MLRQESTRQLLAPRPTGAEKLRDLRRKLGKTQVELGKLLGVDTMTVSRWETGRRPVPKWLWLAMKAIRATPVDEPPVQ